MTAIEFAFGNLIRSTRQQQKWPQHALAAAIGVSRGTIISIEHGKFGCSLETALKLSKLLHIDLNSLRPMVQTEHPTALQRAVRRAALAKELQELDEQMRNDQSDPRQS